MIKLNICLADPGKPVSALQTPLYFIHSFIESEFVKISLGHRHAQMVDNGVFSNKTDYNTIFRRF